MTVRAVKGRPRRVVGGCHLAILVDCSGSMNRYRKWMHARDAALMLLGFAGRYRYDACLGVFTDRLEYSWA